ncbi:hypothetical protein HYW44_00960 [Candidatus Daviesbacteria bacterium]|nr:hypothetical protein [Candidatus Daviesbacteria bacterium]
MKAPAKKVIAVDIDEVLADFLSYFVYFHNLMYKTSAKREDFKNYYLHEILGTDRDEMHIRYLEFKTFSLLERLKPIKGAHRGIKKLIELGYAPHLLTARPKVIEKETRKWLDIHFKGIDLPLHFARDERDKFKKKSIVCKEIGAKIIIEDHLDNALDCSESGIKVFLIDAPWNQSESLPENVVRVKSWREIVEKIK